MIEPVRGAGRWDRSLARRAALIAALGFVLIALIVITTDEGGPLVRRLGMIAALGPVAAGLGAFGAARVARDRGEIAALAAIGVDPRRAVAGAAVGAMAVAALGALVAIAGAADLSALFPRPSEPRVWIVEGDRLIERSLGIEVDASGSLTLLPPAPNEAPLPRHARSFAALSILLLAIGCPLWAARFGVIPLLRRAAPAAIALALTLVAFQAVAAGRAPAWTLLVGSLVLLFSGLIERRALR